MTRKLESVQVLRALAALAVTVSHTYAETQWMALYTGHPNSVPGMVTGAAGVDLFFVISGFVMVYASGPLFGARGGAATFLRHRLIRIVPLYWIATLVTVAYWLWGLGTSLEQEGITPYRWLTSLLFVQDGDNYPILGVGWSLNYEMLFYLLFTVALLLKRRWAVPALSVFMGWFAFHGHALGLPVALAYFGNSTILEFVAGMVIGLAYCEGLRIPRWLAAMAGALGGALFVAFATWDGAMVFRREIMWGGASALLLVAALWAIEPRKPGGRAWRFLVLIGEASYALYLFHGLAFVALRGQSLRLAVWLYQAPALYAALLVALAIAVSLAVHVVLERPLTHWLRRPTSRPAEPVRVAPALLPIAGTASAAAPP